MDKDFNPRSATELLKAIEAEYGDEAVKKISFDEANQLLYDALLWAHQNDLPMQDYYAENCDRMRDDYRYEEDCSPFVQCLIDALKEMDDHLKQGQALGLTPMEQTTLDILWSWVPHNYPDNYVACAREVAQLIENALPPSIVEPRSKEAFKIHFSQLLKETKLLAEKYDVDFVTDRYNLTLGYLYDWMQTMYGDFEYESLFDYLN